MRLLVVTLLALSACTGSFAGGMDGVLGTERGDSMTGGGTSGTGGVVPPFEPTHFACDAQQLPTELPLRRLTRRQYLNVVNELVGRSGLVAADQTAVQTAIRDEFSPFPEDRVVVTEAELVRLDVKLKKLPE